MLVRGRRCKTVCLDGLRMRNARYSRSAVRSRRKSGGERPEVCHGVMDLAGCPYVLLYIHILLPIA